MLVNITPIENKKSRLKAEISEIDHTLLNLLVKRLQENKDVKIAVYNIEHPLTGVPKILIETSSSSTPKDALEKAIKDLKKENADFQKAFAKAF